MFKYKLLELCQYKDRYKGQSCYIFGDGVSIKWFDLDEFSDKVSITCGLIPWHKKFKSLKVHHSVILEPWLSCPPVFGINDKTQYLFSKNGMRQSKIIIM